MTAPKLTYTRDELLAHHDYARKLTRKGRTFHGGLLADGSYRPPRSLHRIDAIRAWSDQVVASGGRLEVMNRQEIIARNPFFPTVEQAKLLLRHGCKDAMTRLLTMIGVIEGFGNDGIRLLPPLDMQKFFVEPVQGTCLDHLHRGLLSAHGQDEAGSGVEAGHDEMWFAIRDAALDDPEVTDSMFENLPIAPPPGYQGRAKASPDALVAASQGGERLFPELAVALELTLRALAQILLVEHGAYATFNWAREVLADPACSAQPVWAPQMVDYIQADEDIHVSYLNCALAETSTRTLVGERGERLPGRIVVARICEAAIERQSGERVERMKRDRYQHILRELDRRPDGQRILAAFRSAGPVPAISSGGAP